MRAGGWRWPSRSRRASAATWPAAPREIGLWLDGAMPMRAEVARGYVIGLHTRTLTEAVAQATGSPPAGLAGIEVRYRYNPRCSAWWRWCRR